MSHKNVIQVCTFVVRDHDALHSKRRVICVIWINLKPFSSSYTYCITWTSMYQPSFSENSIGLASIYCMYLNCDWNHWCPYWCILKRRPWWERSVNNSLNAIKYDRITVHAQISVGPKNRIYYKWFEMRICLDATNERISEIYVKLHDTWLFPSQAIMESPYIEYLSDCY